MLSAEQIREVVERDVRLSFGGVFPPTDGFRLLVDDAIDFQLGERDIPEGDVSFVSWEYHGEHTGAFRCVEGVDASGQSRLFIDPEPKEIHPIGDSGIALAPTERPVVIVGTTLVLSRNAAEEAEPVLMRFIDWSRVFTQLGYEWSFVTRV